MGEYSYFRYQEGCIIDSTKLKIITRLGGFEPYYDLKGLEDENLGEFLNEWKIQGYWYTEFIRFLYDVIDCMNGLTEEIYDNYIEMEYMGIFLFRIFFYLVDGEPTIHVEYIPEEWLTMRLDRPKTKVEK